MKNLFVLLMVLVMSVLMIGFNVSAKEVNFVDALIQVESNGNVDAVGDNGKALGCLQIHKICIEIGRAHV